MSNGFKVPVPINEPIKDYAPNSEEKKSLVAKINELSSEDIDSLKENSHLASKELCWENEKDKIMKIMGLS